MFDGRAFHYMAVVVGKATSECVGRVSHLKKVAATPQLSGSG